MKNNKDLKNLMNSLLGKEIDTGILLGVFSDYYNKSIEALTSVLKLKIIQCTNLHGTECKGIVSYEGEVLTINLDCVYSGSMPKYILRGVE